MGHVLLKKDAPLGHGCSISEGYDMDLYDYYKKFPDDS